MKRIFPRNRRDASRVGSRVRFGTLLVATVSLVAGLSSVLVVSGVASAHDVTGTTIYSGATPACTNSGAKDASGGTIYSSCTETGGSAVTSSTTLTAPATVFDTAVVHNMTTPTTVELTYDLFTSTTAVTNATCPINVPGSAGYYPSGVAGYPDLPTTVPTAQKFVYANPSSSFPYANQVDKDGYNVPYGTSVSPSFTGLAPGNYYIIAYTDWDVPSLIGLVGKTSQLYAPITCEPFTVSLATPSVVTTPTVSGTSSHDTATVSGTAGTPTGSVIFKLYNTTSATPSSGGSVVYTSPAEALNAGVAMSPTESALTPGYYYWVASYTSTSANYSSLTGTAEPFNIAQVTPTVTVTPTTPTCDTATVSATVTGSAGVPSNNDTVTFTLYNAAGAVQESSSAIALNAGTATWSNLGTLTPGSYYVKANYSGGAIYSSETGTSLTFAVNSCAATLSTTPTSNGTSAYDTATVTGSTGTPTGSVIFKLFSTTSATPTSGGSVYYTSPAEALVGGTVVSPTQTNLPSGYYYWVDSYTSTSSYPSIAAGTPEPFTIQPTSSTVNVTETSSCSSTSASVTVTGSLSKAPTGTVIFKLFNSSGLYQTYAALNVSGGTAVPLPSVGTLPPGTYHFTVDYSGDNFYSSSSGVSPTFTVVACTLNLSTSPSVNGTSASDTATVTGSPVAPTGTVTFGLFATGGTTAIDTSTAIALSGGTATWNPTDVLAPGSYYFVATYTPDSASSAYYSTETGSNETFSVGTVPPLVTVTPSSTCLIASVSASVSGTYPLQSGDYVTFSLFATGSTTAIDTSGQIALSGGTATWNPTDTLSPGSYYFLATFPGDSNYSLSTGTGTFGVSACTVNVSTTPTITGTSASDTATVTGTGSYTPTGKVTFALWSGTYPGTLVTTYTDPAETLVVNGNTATASTTVSTGSLAPGNYYFVATYTPDGAAAAYYTSAVVVGSPEPFSIASGSVNVSTTPTITGTSASDTATVTGTNVTPTGTVTFTLWSGTYPGTLVTTYTDPAETLVVNGNTATASTTVSTGSLAPGSYYFVATYTPDGAAAAYYTSATVVGSPEVIVITTPPPGGGGGPPPPPVSLSLSTNPTVSGSTATDTATVNGSGATPTGSVTFTLYSGTYPNGTLVSSFAPDTVTLSGNTATSVTTGTLAPGSYYFIATYSGDATYAAITTGTPEPFTIASAAPAGTVTPPSNPVYKIPSAAPQTGAGGTALATFNGGLLTLGGLMLAAGLAAMALLFRRRRHA